MYERSRRTAALLAEAHWENTLLRNPRTRAELLLDTVLAVHRWRSAKEWTGTLTHESSKPVPLTGREAWFVARLACAEGHVLKSMEIASKLNDLDLA